MSLVRAVGTTLAPAILVGLLANSLAGMPTTLMDQMPKQITLGALPHAAELQAKFERLKADPAMAERLDGLEIPDLSVTTVDIDMGSSAGALPPELQQLLRSADVTTIVDRSVQVAEYFFDQQTPGRVAQIQAGVQSGVEALTEQDAALAARIAALGQQGAPTAGLVAARTEIQTTITQLQELSAAVPEAFEEARTNYLQQLRTNGPQLEATFQHELNMGFVNLFWFYAISSAAVVLLLTQLPGRAHFTSRRRSQDETASPARAALNREPAPEPAD